MRDLTGGMWHKNTRSGGVGGDCVEVTINLPGIAAVRDTKHRDRDALVFTHAEWIAFVGGVQDGELDL